MAKGKTSVFFCQECGYESAKWMGQCPACKEWNTFVEEVIDKKQTEKVRKQASAAKVSHISDISVEEQSRMGTGFLELDRVLGGGIVPGSLVLVGGDPGIGKSTEIRGKYFRKSWQWEATPQSLVCTMTM